MAEENETKAQEELRRQARIERDLRAKLAQTIEREREKDRRDKEAKEQQAKAAKRSKRLLDRWPPGALFAAAKALAVSRGREEPNFADLRDGYRLGPPRPV